MIIRSGSVITAVIPLFATTLMPRSSSPKRFRYFPRFGLKTALVTILVVAVLCGFWVNRVGRQRVVIAWIDENNGSFFYDYDWCAMGAFNSTPFPDWITDSVGIDMFARVLVVDFANAHIENIEPLSCLPYIEQVRLNYMEITDLSPLADIPNLTELQLHGTVVSDFTPIKHSKNLRWLIVADETTDDTMQTLRMWLPDCEIRRSFEAHF